MNLEKINKNLTGIITNFIVLVVDFNQKNYKEENI